MSRQGNDEVPNQPTHKGGFGKRRLRIAAIAALSRFLRPAMVVVPEQ